MKAIEFEGVTSIIGVEEGFEPLPVKWEMTVDGDPSTNEMWVTPTFETRWKPDANELRRLQNGEALVIQIIGVQHPPIKVGVHEIIESVTLDGEWERLP